MKTKKYMMMPLAQGLLVTSLAGIPDPAFSKSLQERVGVVLLTKGITKAYEQSKHSHKLNYRTLYRSSPIYKNDYLQTNTNSNIKVRFNNGSITLLSANKVLNVKAYLKKQPHQGEEPVKTFLKDSFRDITGIVSNLSENKHIHNSPADSIGIR